MSSVEQALDSFQRLAGVIGGVGAVLFVLVLIVLFFYRRDFLTKQKGLKEAHERRDKREETYTTLIERNARANEQIAQAMVQLQDAIRSQQAATDRSLQFLATALQHRGEHP